MNRSQCALALLLAAGCGASKTAELPPRTAADVAQAEVDDLKAQAEEQERELRMMKTQLALAQAEARDLREEATDYRRETIRIGPSTNDFVPRQPETRAQGPRPVLRLYGSGGDVPIEQLGVTSGAIPDLPVADAQSEADSPSAIFAAGEPAEHAYRTALRLVRDQQFEEALRIFGEFAAQYPEHPYADNALFWQGEIRFLQRDYGKATETFERVVDTHPNGNKVPDALFKIGLIRLRQGDTVGARQYFDEVQRRFPSTAAAQLASREDGS